MERLFYMMVFFPLMIEVTTLANQRYIFESIIILRQKLKNKEKIGSQGSLYIFGQLLYFIWAAIGLFTFQWWVYILIFILSAAMDYPKHKYFLWFSIDNILSILLILFTIFNKSIFHIHFPFISK